MRAEGTAAATDFPERRPDSKHQTEAVVSSRERKPKRRRRRVLVLAHRTHVYNMRVCEFIIASIFTPQHRVCVCMSDPMKHYNYYTGLFCTSVYMYI